MVAENWEGSICYNNASQMLVKDRYEKARMMNWKSETELIDCLTASLRESLEPRKGKNAWIEQEADTRYGRPDVLVIEFQKGVTSKRVRSTKRNSSDFSPMCAYAMQVLTNRRWIRIESLAAHLRCSAGKAENVASTLRSRRLVLSRNGCIRARPLQEVFAIKRITTYEGKLQKWKYAVEQAERHLWFTGDSYVVIPKMREKVLEKVIESCRAREVGLIVCEEDKSFRVLVTPQYRKLRNTYLGWCLNEKLIDGLANG